jgi:hypothetical protein
MAWSLNGCGTMFYGQRDYRADGTYVTTEWVTAIYIPLIPLRSLRVRYEGPGENRFPIGFGPTDSYAVFQKTSPNWRQVLSTYSVIVLPVGALILIFSLGQPYFSRRPESDNAVMLILVIAVIVPAFLPHYLRYRAKKKAGV